MDFIAQHKITVAIVAVLIVIGGGWFLFVYEPTVDDSLVSSPTSGAAQASARFIELLNRLDEIDLAGEQIFNDPRLDTLIDFKREPTPEPVGKPDPFSPLSSSGADQ